MKPSDPEPPKREMITTSGVMVLVNDPLPPPLPPQPPSPQSTAKRDRFTEDLEKRWGKIIDRNLRHPDLAAASIQDLHQKALDIIAKRHAKLKGPGQVVKFVNTVTRNLLRNRLRRASLNLAAGVDLEAVRDSAPNPEQAVTRATLWKKVEGYLERLPDDEREVLTARELDGMTFEIIATALDCPLTTVFRMHARAMQKLQDMARVSERAASRRVRRPYGFRK